MIWVDREAIRLKQRKFPLEWCDDMKTPSGRIHVGSLRGVIVHDLIYKALIQIGVNARFSYVFNDMDPMDGMPSYLDKNKWQKYMGNPLYNIPSPEPGFKSFAEYFAKEFIAVFNSINCHPDIIWSSELHRSGKMNQAIRTILDKADIVRDIYKRVVKKDRPKDWFPYNPICEKCGKIGTTRTYKWDGKFVYYKCEPDMVTWAQGCDHEGKVEPINENGKLLWKLDWPAHWKVIGVTVESSGKDHMSSGGSYAMGSHFAREVLNYEPPDALGGYEWFTIGGKKMSSSKGIGASAKEVASILPSDIFRFFMVRTPIKTHLDFDPFGDTIPNLFDDYDRCLNAYFLKMENKVPEKKEGEVILDFARIIELSEVNPLPKKRLYLPRFRTIANLIKTKKEKLEEFFEKLKSSELNGAEKAILAERINFAKIYLEKYAKNLNQGLNVKTQNLTFNKKQKEYLTICCDRFIKLNTPSNEIIQKVLLDSIKIVNIDTRIAFQAFYLALTGKTHGPKAIDLIIQIGLRKVIELLQKSLKEKIEKSSNLFPDLKDSKIFSIAPEMVKKYPSINIGIAIIKNVNIQKNNPDLQKELDEFVNSNDSLNNELISSYPEIQSYRKLYKQMGLDWHSKRPSPEALLRRVALKKGLYNVNTCVDAYNLIVMKHRVSVGAFDLAKIKFPTILRFPKEGEQILLLGDHKPTNYKPTDVAYFDRTGGYNIYFNYRDAQRTAVSEKTNDILLNIDGIFDITRELVEQSLKESIEIILKYCGGKVEIAGIVTTS